ncbi:MAG: pyridoxamine 5'-phosphate oxidase family protein, partial [Ktedonobacteraceae bacterium]|nr:pyridoxamine 5'-phosphate oxidase family protein [Ktedonobacteraceae bacterium]
VPYPYNSVAYTKVLLTQHCCTRDELAHELNRVQVQQLYKFPTGDTFIMDAEALQAFLAKPHDAIMATNRPGKGSQLSPVWFLWDGESFLFTSQKATAKYANITRDPNISIIVNDTATHMGVTAYGRAEIVGPERYPELWDTLLAKYIPAERREQVAAAIQAHRRSESIVIVLKPEKIVDWAALTSPTG